MALTKVSGGILDPGISVAGIVTATGFDGPFTGGSGSNITAGIITATGFDLNGNGDISGDLVIGGNLTANGDFTTLNTTLREVEILRVDANTTAVAGIITQRGSGDIFSAYDTSTEVFKIADGGKVLITNTLGLGGATSNPSDLLHAQSTSGEGVIKVLGATDGKVRIQAMNGDSYIQFGDASSDQAAAFQYDHGTDDLIFKHGNSSERLRIKSDGNLNVGVGLTLADNIPASFGNSNDLQIIHQSGENHFLLNSNTFFKGTAAWGVRTASNQTIIGTNATGRTVDLYGGTVNVLSTAATGVTIRGGLHIENAEFNMTTNGSKVLDFETGGTNTVTFRHNPDGGALSTFMQATHGGSLKLYDDSDGAVKLTTTGYGVTVTGIASATSFTASESGITGQYLKNQIKWDRNNYNYIDCTNNSGQFAIRMGSSQTAAFSIDTSADTIFSSNRKIKMSSDKLVLYHSGSDAFYENSTGHTYFRNSSGTSGGLLFRSDGETHISNYAANEYRIKTFNQGGVELFYAAGTYSTPKIKTTATGVTVDGEVVTSQDYPNFRPTLDFNFVAEKKLDPRITYQRTGSASFVNEFGKVVLISDNAPRFDHDPTTSESKGLLIEESRTNYQPYSVDMSQGGNNNGVTVTNNQAIAPDGTMSASKITGGTNQSTSQRLGWGTQGVNSSTHTQWSIWVKSEETSCIVQVYSNTYTIGASYMNIELADGTTQGTTPSSTFRFNIEEYPNKWWRISWGGVGNAGGNSGGMYVAVVPSMSSTRAANTGSAHSKVWFAWGLQEEVASTAQYSTSYIPTYGTTATRGVDITTIDGDEFTEFYNDDEWTMITDTTVDNTQSLVASPTGVNSINFEGDNNTKKFSTRYVTSSTVNQGYVDAIGNMSGSSLYDLAGGGVGNYNMKTAHAAKVNDVAASFNGGTVQTDTSVTMLTGGSIMNIGQNPKQFHIKRIMYYPKRLPNSQLVTLTS